MNQKDFIWHFLPEGLEGYFEVEDIKENENEYKIIMIEKNIAPTKPPDKYKGKKIINNVLKSITINSFPIKGKKCEIILKKRYWKYEGIEEMYCRGINICHEGTKLDKEFADFLKAFDRDSPFISQYIS